MRYITILGSTGSIGQQTLDVISNHPDLFSVLGLAAGKNTALLNEQIAKHKPKVVSVADDEAMSAVYNEFKNPDFKLYSGEPGACEVAAYGESDTVVSAMVGAAGLRPTLEAIRAGKNIALANKESLVVAGQILTKEALANGVKIIPVDSEHSALFQAINSQGAQYIKRLILTASGGPFLGKSPQELEDVTVEDALSHPTWKMGKKITIDSATLMNKAFELIEAKWLFGVASDKLSVWIHPQSIVHSMVEYIDGSIISQMSIPDMRIPISYALAYPQRIALNGFKNSPETFGDLHFEQADPSRFRALGLAMRSIDEGGTVPAVMNGANEVAVEAFLNNEIKFPQIISAVEQVMDTHNRLAGRSLDEVLESDQWARAEARSIIRN